MTPITLLTKQSKTYLFVFRIVKEGFTSKSKFFLKRERNLECNNIKCKELL